MSVQQHGPAILNLGAIGMINLIATTSSVRTGRMVAGNIGGGELLRRRADRQRGSRDAMAIHLRLPPGSRRRSRAATWAIVIIGLFGLRAAAPAVAATSWRMAA